MKYIYRVFVILICLPIAWINFQLYSNSASNDVVHKDIIKELAFVEKALKEEQAAEKMQQLYPEGYFFMNVLYGLSWCELMINDSTFNAAQKEKAIEEITYAYNNIKSAKGYGIFDREISPFYGVFYTGWSNYLLSKMLLIKDDPFLPFQLEFLDNCHRISRAISNSESPYLESYRNQCWPADMCVAMASLANHDRLFAAKHQDLITEWVGKVRHRLDAKYGMLPHKVNFGLGTSIQGPRGSSMSLMLNFLPEIDQELAKEQFELYNTHFRSTAFGLPSVREYPKGVRGFGDVDSGPVIFGVGFSGTIVSIAALAKNESLNSSNSQYLTINAFGFPSENKVGKKYLFGKLPMADVFIAWSRATALNGKVKSTETKPLWRLKFHLISAFIIVLCFLPWIVRSRTLKRRLTRRQV